MELKRYPGNHCTFRPKSLRASWEMRTLRSFSALMIGLSHPVAADFTNDRGALFSLPVQDRRPLTQRVFWTPLNSLGGSA